jgi:hypothetical protein
MAMQVGPKGGPMLHYLRWVLLKGPDGEILATGQNSVLMDMNSFIWVDRGQIGVLGGARFSASANSGSLWVLGPHREIRRQRERQRRFWLLDSSCIGWRNLLSYQEQRDSCLSLRDVRISWNAGGHPDSSGPKLRPRLFANASAPDSKRFAPATGTGRLRAAANNR